MLTDSSGQFLFTDLSAGMYLLRVERNGYARAEYGQRDYGEPGTPISLDDQASFQAVIRLRKLGAISGDVVDTNGVGIPGVTVSAYRAAGRPRQVAAVRTDDRGVFRLAGLAPGPYLVRSSARRLEDGTDLMPTYFPDQASASRAEKLEVTLDGDTAGISLAPRTGDLAEVSGTFSATGTVLLISDLLVREARTQLGTSFHFDSVEPGEYSVVALSENGQGAGYQEVVVGSEDMVINLDRKPLPSLRLVCEVDSRSEVNLDAVSFFFRRSEIDDDNPYRLACGQSADFPPGHWQVAAVPPADLYVAAILDTGSGNDVYELLLRPGESRELRIRLSASPATIEGKVETRDGVDAVGAPVYLRAISIELQRRIGGVRQTRAASDGIYRIPGLPPGRYEVLSSYLIGDPEADPWPAGYATVTELTEGERKTVDLELTTIR